MRAPWPHCFPGDGGRPGAGPSGAPRPSPLRGALPLQDLPQTAPGAGKQLGCGLPSSETAGATHVQAVTAPCVPCAPARAGTSVGSSETAGPRAVESTWGQSLLFRLRNLSTERYSLKELSSRPGDPGCSCVTMEFSSYGGPLF